MLALLSFIFMIMGIGSLVHIVIMICSRIKHNEWQSINLRSRSKPPSDKVGALENMSRIVELQYSWDDFNYRQKRYMTEVVSSLVNREFKNFKDMTTWREILSQDQKRLLNRGIDQWLKERKEEYQHSLGIEHGMERLKIVLGESDDVV